MGLEPTTFCMASARNVRTRSRPFAQSVVFPGFSLEQLDRIARQERVKRRMARAWRLRACLAAPRRTLAPGNVRHRLRRRLQLRSGLSRSRIFNLRVKVDLGHVSSYPEALSQSLTAGDPSSDVAACRAAARDRPELTRRLTCPPARSAPSKATPQVILSLSRGVNRTQESSASTQGAEPGRIEPERRFGCAIHRG